jgi:hypothetical protein
MSWVEGILVALWMTFTSIHQYYVGRALNDHTKILHSISKVQSQGSVVEHDVNSAYPTVQSQGSDNTL